MAEEFVRIGIFRADYRWLCNKFGGDETRPAQGILVANARNHIASLESEINEINKVLKVNK